MTPRLRRLFAAVAGKGSGATPWYLAAGVTPVAAYQGKGAASYTASKVNLANPGTYDLTSTADPTWSVADGWTFGSSKFLDTGVVPADNQGWTFVIQYQGCSLLGSNYVFGSYSSGGASVVGVQPNRAGGVLTQYGNAGNYVINAPVLVTGNYTVSGRNLYRDGVLEGTNLSAVALGNTFATTYLGGAHLTTGALQSPIAAGKVQAFAMYNSLLSAGQVLTTYNAIIAQGFFLAP